MGLCNFQVQSSVLSPGVRQNKSGMSITVISGNALLSKQPKCLDCYINKMTILFLFKNWVTWE